MNNSRVIRFFICVILIFVFSTGMIACSNDKSKVKVLYNIEECEYSIIKQGGHCYIVFDEDSKYQKVAPGSMAVGDVRFSSISEFVDAVTKGTLNENQLKVVANFKKDEAGRVHTCDFTNLYSPALPSDWDISAVYWSGLTYAFSLSNEEESFANFLYCSKDTYNRTFESEYTDFFERKLISVTKTEYLSGNQKVATYYSTSAGNFLKIRYTLSIGDKTFMVDKKYRLSEHEVSDVTNLSVAPTDITMYCVEKNQNYIIYIHDLVTNPTDEWLLQFGIKKYSNNTNVIK